VDSEEAQNAPCSISRCVGRRPLVIYTVAVVAVVVIRCSLAGAGAADVVRLMWLMLCELGGHRHVARQRH